LADTKAFREEEEEEEEEEAGCSRITLTPNAIVQKH